MSENNESGISLSLFECERLASCCLSILLAFNMYTCVWNYLVVTWLRLNRSLSEETSFKMLVSFQIVVPPISQDHIHSIKVLIWILHCVIVCLLQTDQTLTTLIQESDFNWLHRGESLLCNGHWYFFVILRNGVHNLLQTVAPVPGTLLSTSHKKLSFFYWYPGTSCVVLAQVMGQNTCLNQTWWNRMAGFVYSAGQWINALTRRQEIRTWKLP